MIEIIVYRIVRDSVKEIRYGLIEIIVYKRLSDRDNSVQENER